MSDFAEDTNVPTNDFISRQAAIEAMSSWDWQELYLPVHFKQLLEELPSAEPLTEEDYTELRDRFGEYVEFVVRDMITGKGERWK